MEPIKKEIDKRKTAGFVPYRRRSNEYEYFLQKRCVNARSNAGLFGLFGGGIENVETPDEALQREIMEELVFEPKNPVYFSRYEIATAVLHVYMEEVAADFESKVTVQEGEYGKFFTAEEIKNMQDISLLAKTICLQVDEFLTKE